MHTPELDMISPQQCHFPVLAQVSDEAARSFIERLPDILRAAATNPLSLVALIVLVLTLFSLFFFKGSREKNKLTVLRTIIGCVLVLALVVIYQWNRSPAKDKTPGGDQPVGGTDNREPRDCKVSGYVYNEDTNPAGGIQNVKLAYRASSPTNSPPVQVATTSPNGHFSFNCSQIKVDAFPIHLRATFLWSGANQVIESDDTLLFGENTDVNLYVSPRAVSNHYRLNKEVMRVSSAQLLRNNYSPLKDSTGRLPTNGVVTIPKATRISREAIDRLRRTQ
jgi:hypothetical protein